MSTVGSVNQTQKLVPQTQLTGVSSLTEHKIVSPGQALRKSKPQKPHGVKYIWNVWSLQRIQKSVISHGPTFKYLQIFFFNANFIIISLILNKTATSNKMIIGWLNKYSNSKACKLLVRLEKLWPKPMTTWHILEASTTFFKCQFYYPLCAPKKVPKKAENVTAQLNGTQFYDLSIWPF